MFLCVAVCSFKGAQNVILGSLGNASADKMERLWSRDSGFINNRPLENYTNPIRSFSLSEELRLHVRVNDSKRLRQFTSELIAIFHAPDVVPTLGHRTEVISIVPGKQNNIEITVQLVVSEGIEHYEPEVRKCYFSNERHLKFYKNYTQNQCEFECYANFTLEQCGCSSYHFPHFNDTKLCRTEMEFECLVIVSPQFLLPKFIDNVPHAPIDICNCLPSCTQLSYEVLRTRTLVDESSRNEGFISICNKDPRIKKYVRTELHSISEFFSSCGGSLGLFLGVSIFSVLELLYFCTVRLYFNCKRGLHQ